MIRREKTMRRGSIRPGSKQNMYLASPSPTKLPGMPFKHIHQIILAPKSPKKLTLAKLNSEDQPEVRDINMMRMSQNLSIINSDDSPDFKSTSNVSFAKQTNPDGKHKLYH